MNLDMLALSSPVACPMAYRVRPDSSMADRSSSEKLFRVVVFFGIGLSYSLVGVVPTSKAVWPQSLAAGTGKVASFEKRGHLGSHASHEFGETPKIPQGDQEGRVI
jgi:hypothetical protein